MLVCARLCDKDLREAPDGQDQAAWPTVQTKSLQSFCGAGGAGGGGVVAGKAKGALGRAAHTVALEGRGKFPGPVNAPDTAEREKENIKKLDYLPQGVTLASLEALTQGQGLPGLRFNPCLPSHLSPSPTPCTTLYSAQILGTRHPQGLPRVPRATGASDPVMLPVLLS